MPTTPEEKVFQDVQLHVDFTQASTRSNISTYDPTAAEPENISTAFGKLSKWYEALVPTGGSDGQFLGWNSDGTAKWVNNPNADTKVTQQSTSSQKYRPILFGYTEATDPSGLTSTVTNKAFVTSKFYVKPSTGQMFIDGLLQISNSSYGPLTIKRTTTANAGIRFENSNGFLGSLGIGTVDGVFKRYLSDNSTYYTILDTGNTSVTTTGSGNAITSLSFSNGVFTADKGSTFLTQHPTITLSADTTSTPPQLSHGGTFTAITSVTREGNGHVTKINTATYTLPNDTSMTQTNTTGSADYRVLLSGNANDTTETTTGRKSTNLKFNPSTGVLSASSGVTTKTITRSALKGMLTGSGTAAQDKGSGVSPRYFPAKWTFNTGLTAANGDIFIIKLPTAGHSYGVFLSIDNGANYYPISVNGTSRLTTHYGNGYSIAVMFKSDGSTADVFPLAGGDSRSTVTGGCWQVLNYYDSGNTNTKVNVTLGTTTKAYLLGTSTTPTSSAQAVTSIADTGVYLGTTAGSLYATTFYGALSGNATSATTASKLGSSTVGSTRKPIYLNSGTATEANYMVSHFGNAGKSNMNDVGKMFASVGMTNLSDPGNTVDNPMNGTTKSTSWHLYWDACYSDDPSGSNGWVAQIANKAGSAQWWVRSRQGGTITNGTEWSAGWEHLTITSQAGAGSATNPVYVDSNGHTQACTYSLNKSVPSNALFTDANVTQSATTTEDFRPILMGATHVSGSSTGLDATVTGSAYVSTKLFCQPSTGNLYVTGDIERANNTLSLWSGNDCAGVSQRNNCDINTWYGFSVSNACTTTGTLNKVAFSVNARNGQAWHTGNVHLYSASGDSPALVFQRGTFVDDLNDWKIYVSGGELRFAQSTANASSETWTTKMCFHASDGNLYVGSTKVSLNGHTHNYAGSASAGGPALSVSTAGGDVVLGTPSSSSDDSGDIVWKYGNGQEKARLWQDNTYTAKAGPQYRVYKSDGTGLYSGRLPLADGTSASGTWEISITGTAANVAWSGVTSKPVIHYGYNTAVGNTTDWNTLTDAGCYKIQMASWGNATTYHSPNAYLSTIYSFGLLFNVKSGVSTENRLAQIYMPHNQWPIVVRWHNSSDGAYTAGWGDWKPIYQGISKSDVGLGNVENKSSATIRGELTSSNVTTALGFTPANSTHTHDYAGSSSAGGAANSANVLNSNTKMDYGWNGVNYFNISGTAGNAAKVNDTPTTAWWHIMRFNHNNNAGYYTDLAIPFNATSLYYKRITNGSVQNGGWVKVLDALNVGYVMSSVIKYDPHVRRFTSSKTNSAWDAQAYSNTGYADNVYVSFRPGQTTMYAMIGLDANPSEDANYNKIDYCWYIKNDGSLQVYESGTAVTITGHTTYASGDEFRVEYSCDEIRYYHNGTMCRSVTRAVSGKLFFDSSFHNAGNVYDFSYGTSTHSTHTAQIITSTYKSSTYVTSLTSSVITLSDKASSFGGWICGPTKNGRIVISSYQGDNDKLYFGYGERGRTTNSYVKAMTWDGPTNTLTADKFVGALQGNATTATTATKVATTVTNGTTSTVRYGIAFVADPDTSNEQAVLKNYDFRFNLLNGTDATGNTGNAEIVLGNNKSSGTAGNKKGVLTLYSTGSYYGGLNTGTLTANRTYTLPDAGGTIALTTNTGVGSSWWNDRDNAVIRITTADSSYRPLWSLLTSTTGSWAVGNHNNDNLVFNFISKATYDTGTNPDSNAYKQVKFTNTGGITTTGGISALSYTLSGKANGYYGYDQATKKYCMIGDSGSNLWIGTFMSAEYHHKGSTFISAGWTGTLPTAASSSLTGNTTIKISVPVYTVDANGNGSWNQTAYDALHSGNYTSYALATTTKYAGSSSVGGAAISADVTVTDVPSTSTTTSDSWYRSYGLLFAQNPNTTQANTLRKSHNLRFYHSPNGTADTVGVGELIVGNNTASGTAGNMQGRLILYSSSSSYISMVPTATSSSVILTLPAVTGTVPSFTATPTSGQVVITDGTGGGIKSSGSTIVTTPSSKVNTNWGTTSDRTTIVTKGWMSYWDGSYNGSASNLTYCNKGAFGTIITKNTGDYVPSHGDLNGTIGSNSPAADVKTFFMTSSVPSGCSSIGYNTSGNEYTLIFGKGVNTNGYGAVLRFGYNSSYPEMLRIQNGSWKSTDWEKISAGYADSAGKVLYNTDTNSSDTISIVTADIPANTNHMTVIFKVIGSAAGTGKVYVASTIPYIRGVYLGGVLHVSTVSDDSGSVKLSLVPFTIQLTTSSTNTSVSLIHGTPVKITGGSTPSDRSGFDIKIVKIIGGA